MWLLKVNSEIKCSCGLLFTNLPLLLMHRGYFNFLDDSNKNVLHRFLVETIRSLFCHFSFKSTLAFWNVIKLNHYRQTKSMGNQKTNLLWLSFTVMICKACCFKRYSTFSLFCCCDNTGNIGRIQIQSKDFTLYVGKFNLTALYLDLSKTSK